VIAVRTMQKGMRTIALGIGALAIACTKPAPPAPTVGLAEAAGCRRVRLLAYFGEASTACGNCDNCLNPPRVRDGTATSEFAPAKAELIRPLANKAWEFAQSAGAR